MLEMLQPGDITPMQLFSYSPSLSGATRRISLHFYGSCYGMDYGQQGGGGGGKLRIFTLKRRKEIAEKLLRL